MKKILILGGGFGGLVTAENLAESLDGEHQITLVSPNKTFTFYPALVRLAFGQLKEEDVTFDLEKKLNKIGVKFVEGEVLHIFGDGFCDGRCPGVAGATAGGCISDRLS